MLLEFVEEAVVERQPGLVGLFLVAAGKIRFHAMENRYVEKPISANRAMSSAKRW